MTESRIVPENLKQALNVVVSVPEKKEKEVTVASVLDLKKVLTTLETEKGVSKSLKTVLEEIEGLINREDFSKIFKKYPLFQTDILKSLLESKKVIEDLIVGTVKAPSSGENFPKGIKITDSIEILSSLETIHNLIYTYIGQIESLLSDDQKAQLGVLEKKDQKSELEDFSQKVSSLSEKLTQTTDQSSPEYFDPRKEKIINRQGSEENCISALADYISYFEQIYTLDIGSVEERKQTQKLIDQYVSPAKKLLQQLNARIAVLEKEEIDSWKVSFEAESFVEELKKLLQEQDDGKSTSLEELKTKLENALQRIRLSSLEDPTSRDKYKQFVEDSYIKPATEKIKTLNLRLQEIKEKTISIDEIKDSLKQIEKAELKVSSQDDGIKEAYAFIYTRLENLKSKLGKVEELKDLEIQILISEYNHRRKATLAQMEHIENINMGMSGYTDTLENAFKTKLFARIDELLVRLESICEKTEDKNLLEALKSDYEQVSSDFARRKLAHFAWLSTHESILGGSKDRTPPGEMDDNKLPLFGNQIQEAIRGGLINPEFGGPFSNFIIGEKTFEVNSFDTPDTTDQVTVQETALGWCMRLFDKVYRGESTDIFTADGSKFTSQNLHYAHPDLVSEVYKKLIQEIKTRRNANGENLSEDEIKALVPQNVVTRAFRLHMMITLNSSYEAPGSPTMKDNIYYLFNWLEYCYKYSLAGTNSFNPLVTYLLFSYPGVNPVEELLGAEAVNTIRAKLEKEDLYYSENAELFEELGISGFLQLIEPPLIGVRNVALGQKEENGQLVDRIKTPIFSPPLRFFTIKENGKVKRAKVLQQDGTVTDGQPITFDDYMSTDGERLYELMPFEQIGSGMVEYYNQLNTNGMGLLDMALKAPEARFLKELDDPDFGATLRNQGKYSMALFPVVGEEILNDATVVKYYKIGSNEKDLKNYEEITKEEYDTLPPTQRKLIEKSLGTTVMNQVIIQLVFAKCLIQTEPSREHRWNMNQVRSYLSELANKGALGSGKVGYEVAKAIEIATEEGRKWQLRTADFLKRMQDQLKEVAKVK